MSLAALIVVDEDKVGADLRVFGMPLVEVQARLAQAAGAIHIVIVTAQVPASLVAALDRLRSRGLNAVLARTATEAAGHVHPDETVLLFEPGYLPGQALINRLIQSEKFAIATVPLDPSLRHQELIDADHGWAGIAFINGALVRKSAELPGDWSLSSALLRFAVQEGAERVALDESTGLQVHPITNEAAAVRAAQALVSGVNLSVPGISGRVLEPVATLVARQLARFAVPPLAGDVAAVLLLVGVAGLGLAGWTLASVLGFIVAQTLALVAQKMDRAALASSPVLSYVQTAMPWVARLLLLLAGYQMFAGGTGWGAMAVALWLVWELWLARFAKGQFYADEGSALLLVGSGLAFGYPLIGLGIALVHSLGGRFRTG